MNVCCPSPIAFGTRQPARMPFSVSVRHVGLVRQTRMRQYLRADTLPGLPPNRNKKKANSECRGHRVGDGRAGAREPTARFFATHLTRPGGDVVIGRSAKGADGPPCHAAA